MALRINTNVAALSAHQKMIQNDNKLSESLGRLSTGLRINKAADDASGMAIADSLKAQHLGIGQAIRNANDGISMVQTADGALEESINIVNTIKTKAIQAASDGQTTETRKAIQADIDALMEELDVIAKTTSFNGQKLLSGVFTNKKIQIGAYANETANISIGSTESTKTGHISTAKLSLGSESGGEIQLTITSSITGEDLTLNKIDIQSNNTAESGIGALADEINRYTAVTGIKATEVVESTTGSAIQAGTTGSNFSVNGINIGAITVTDNDSSGALVSAINGKTTEHGVTATMNEDGTMTLTSTDGRAIDVDGDVSAVFGSTSTQMSTLGYINLSQSGTSQFQINGIGAGATGANIDISADLTTVEDSVIAAGSTINAGSMLAAGTTVGGDALVESSIAETATDYELKSGSTLYSFSQIAKGTELSGSVTVGGATAAATGAAAATATALDQEMVAASGSTLTAGSVLGKDTVVTTEFTQGTVTYSVGDTLTSAVTLTSNLTLQSDMTLTYSSTTSENSGVFAGSTLASGSTMGVELSIGFTYSAATGGYQAVAASTASGVDIYYTATETISNTGGNALLKAGSLLTDGTTMALDTAGGTWTGPTLVTTTGTLEQGDTFAAGLTITLDGDQVLSEDLGNGAADFLDTGGATAVVMAADSVLLTGSVNDVALAAAGAGVVVSLDTATLADDMTLESGSELSAGSKLLSGSVLGDNTYVMGGSLDATHANLTTYDRTLLAAGSQIESSSIMAEGSTVGGVVTLANDETLESDMTLTAGTGLAGDTKIEKGTILNQDMTLYSLNDTGSGSVTTYELKAGDVLSDDLYVGNSTGDSGTVQITLSADMTLKKDSIVGDGSTLALNTANSGSVGLSDEANMRLSDLSVLTQEDAQFAIEIAEAALKDLDETRSGLGSVQNQLTSTIANLSVTKTNIQASESAIRDVDFAEEASTYSKLNLLSQTSSYALAQANASSQNIMSLLQ